MVKSTVFIALIVALFGVQIVSAGTLDWLEDDGELLLRDRRATGSACGKKLFENMKQCCDEPKDIFSPKDWADCSNAQKNASPGKGNATTTTTSTTTTTTTTTSSATTAATVDDKCAPLNCILKNHNLVNSTGDLNVTKLITKFNSVETDKEWRKVFETAAKNCAADLGAGPSGDDKRGICKKCGPRQVIKCIHQALLLNCVKKIGTASDKCDDKRKKLNACKPFASCDEPKN